MARMSVGGAGVGVGVAVGVSVGVCGTPQGLAGDALFRGAGSADEKSAPFWSVSVQPPSARRAAVVLPSAGAAAAPSKKLALP
jgi:hypothetical protein